MGDGAVRRWRYFTLAEFACSHCGACETDHGFIDRLDELRERVGFPLHVSSGYRCPTHNQAVSHTGPAGPHTKSAVDFAVSHTQAHIVLREALAMGFQGIGVKQHGDGRFIHLDDLPNAPGQPRPTVWSYP